DELGRAHLGHRELRRVELVGGRHGAADELDTTQLTVDQMGAAGAEAQAIEAGVRSIEHGNLIREAAAKAIKDAGAFLVPTMVTYEAIWREGKRYGIGDHRSEEHTSELQSLPTISYAVFCLK